MLSQHIDEEQQLQQKRDAIAKATALAASTAAAAAAAPAPTAISKAINATTSTTTTSNNISAKSAANNAAAAAASADNYSNHVNNHNDADAAEAAALARTTTKSAAAALSESGADALILENAKLQATVEQYKTIVTETVSAPPFPPRLWRCPKNPDIISFRPISVIAGRHPHPSGGKGARAGHSFGTNGPIIVVVWGAAESLRMWAVDV